MTSPTPTLAPPDSVGSLTSLPTIPSLLTFASGVSGDLEDNILHHRDIGARPFNSDLTPSVPSLGYSPFSVSASVKGAYVSSSFTSIPESTLEWPDSPLKISSCRLSCRSFLGCSSTRDRRKSYSKKDLCVSPQQNQYILDSMKKLLPETSIPWPLMLDYKFIATVGHGRKVLLSRNGNSKGCLYVLKITPNDSYPYLKELDFLRFATRTSIINQPGTNFLQTLVEDFEDVGYFITILEYHSTTLSTPDIAMRFRMPESLIFFPPTSLPLSADNLSTSMSFDRVLYYFQLLLAEISLGLLYLHGHGIIHQDINPETVMISEAGHVVIGDFGAASRMPIGNRGSPPNPTSTSSCLIKDYGPIVLQPDEMVTFTPLYAAPELRQRNQAGLVVYDECVDWWAVGILAYELITGTVPLHSSSDMDDYWRNTKGMSPCVAPTGVPIIDGRYQLLRNFLHSLLDPDPNARLSGNNVKTHSFFDPISELWPEIAALEHPPCPKPSRLYTRQGVSVDFDPQAKLFPQKPSLDPGAVNASNSFGIHQPKSRELYIPRTRFLTSDTMHQPNQGERTSGFQLHSNYEEEESDHGSVIQALPSTASIYFNLEQTISESTSTRGSLYMRATGDGGDVLSERVSFGSIPRSFKDNFVLQSSLDIRSNSPFIPQRTSSTATRNFRAEKTNRPTPYMGETCTPAYAHPAMLSRSILPEKITLSLLKAMDNRDRQYPTMEFSGISAKIDHSQKSTQTPQRLVQVFAGRMLKKLHFW